MLYTEQNVRAGLRVRDGKRVFYLDKGDQLTASARDWLRSERVEIIPHAQTAPKEYKTLFGAVLTQKPEHMTHLHDNVLVFKDHPRIAFRGMIDTLEAEILLCQLHIPKLQAQLQELLDFVRSLIRCDVLGEPVGEMRLCGMNEAEMRERSHNPQKFFDQPHFMPDRKDSAAILYLNRLRTIVRKTELAAYRAFKTPDGGVEREDMIRALNRLSSLIWIWMIQEKGND